jgi:hypothetical protein
MSFLEQKIKNNPGFFDRHQPPSGHEARFVAKLAARDSGEEHDINNRSFWLKTSGVAAAVIVTLFFVYQYKNDFMKTAVTRTVHQIQLSEELNAVFEYYETLTNAKVIQIDQLTAGSRQSEYVRSLAQKQLENLDASLAEIKKEYAKNPGNKRLQAALINNKRKKAEIVEHIVKQLSDAKLPPAQPGDMNP